MTEITTEDTIEQIPRQQHYVFVHKYLKDKCLESPLAALEDYYFHKHSTKNLKLSWVTLGFEFKRKDEDFIGHEGVQAFPFEVSDRYKCAIFTFPPPERVAEAFMSAIIVPNHHSEDENVKSRYITLEYNPGRPNQTYIGEWKRHCHLNFGSGPPPTVENFHRVVLCAIEKEEKRPPQRPMLIPFVDEFYW